MGSTKWEIAAPYTLYPAPNAYLPPVIKRTILCAPRVKLPQKFVTCPNI